MQMENLSGIQQLMLKACITDSNSELEALVSAWEEQVVMDDLPYSCMRLCPLFYYKIEQAGLQTRYDKRLKVIYKHWWLKTEHILNQLKLVHTAFTDAAITPVIFKGASIMHYYTLPVHRPMADFDLLIDFKDLFNALAILEDAGYVPNKEVKKQLTKHPKLSRDFDHSIECVHYKTDTRLDLHWRIGSHCSYRFTHKLLQNLREFNTIPGAKRSDLAHELCLTIIHAIECSGRDNLNWIIDIHILNQLLDAKDWQRARNLALEDNKAALFDYGCYVLIEHGVYALSPPPDLNKDLHLVLDYEQMMARRKSFMHYLKLRKRNYTATLNYLFPHAGPIEKSYHGLRRIFLAISRA